MKFKVVSLVVLVLVVIAGCASSKSEMVGIEREYAEQAKDTAAATSGGGEGNTAMLLAPSDDSGAPLEPSEHAFARMIVYNAAINLIVKDTTAAQEAITQMVTDWDGYISNAGSYAYDNGLQHINLTLRVPVESFNVAMTALRDMALEVSRENISSQDVTQEYVDLESRLDALEVKADRLEILMEQAEDTEAVLEVYEHLSATQMEIEQTKGRMRYLERSSAMATIEVQLTPDELSRPVEIAGWRPTGTLKRAVEALIEALQFLIDALIWLIILVTPVLLFIGFVLFIFVKALGLIFKRRKHKHTPDAAQPTGKTSSS